ncbi:Delta(8)-fatty-acid desaturase 2 [Ananas comosus]|uniref:Delta(8)-fatty-acid desaturase 2 n=1 Tax=Ananas comosus TaxID=4615 RepID=A0A199W0L1_ANACO|nr:Delta(8)-fatty-acid desaturase 2 [Ananas comosus]
MATTTMAEGGENNDNDAAAAGPKAVRCVSTEELRKHSTASDLWIAIGGKVYDVTRWLPSHPGGDLPLLSLAGSDATDAFLAYHPPSAFPLLPRFLVGRLSDPAVSPASADYRRLCSQFSRLGLFRPSPLLPSLSLLAMLALLLSAVLLVRLSPSPLAHLLSGALVGLLWIQSGWMGHDSGHYPILPSRGLNRLLQICSGNCVTGISIAWWKRNHNAHHIACNSLDFDPDLQHLPLFAVSPRLFAPLFSVFYRRTMPFGAAARLLVSYQHLTFYPVMCVARVNLLAQSGILLLSGRNVPNRLQEIAGVAVFWVWYPLLVSCLPDWRERAAFVLASFAVTGIQHVQFCLNHFSSEVFVGPPAGNDWFERQTMASLDISCPPWMDWFHGGLQFQVEHHLFPRIPRCRLRKIAPFVRDLCKKHNLPYATASFWEANAMTIRTLRAAAMQARNAKNAAPKNLLWEALNTHG